jgi:hypothetical protein
MKSNVVSFNRLVDLPPAEWCVRYPAADPWKAEAYASWYARRLEAGIGVGAVVRNDSAAPAPIPFDRQRVEADLRRRHEWAKPFAPGLLNLFAVYSDPDVKEKNQGVKALNVEIGDVAGSVDFVMSFDGKPHWNVYTGLSAYQAGLSRNKRPSLSGCVGVFGLIADCDTDKSRNRAIAVEATFEINSSPDNYQRAFIFSNRVTAKGAGPAALALRNATQSDDGTIDLGHVWRIDGTLNWPGYVKVHERGRSREPFPVRITAADFSRTYELDALHLALLRAAPAPGEPISGRPSEASPDAEALFRSLPQYAQDATRSAAGYPSRSEATFAALCAMARKGLSNKQMKAVVALYPDGPFERNTNDKGLDKEIDRAREEVAKGPEPLAYETILAHIGELPSADEEGARRIVAESVASSLSDLQIEALIKPLSKALGVGIAVARKFWKDAEAGIRAETRPPPPTEEERERLEREEQERQAREIEAERARLWNSCSKIALAPTLLADMEDLVHRLGMVGEGTSIRGEYLAMSSRLNRLRAICLLRRGAPAGGKNFLIDKILELIPVDSVVRMSSGSPLNLVYYGGADEDALKYKVLYVPEAAILAETKTKAENPQTIMLRLLISEGRLDHQVVVPQDEGPPATVHIKRNGPVAVTITSARDNIEDELLTRLMVSDADESTDQTNAVLADILSNEDRDVDPEEIARWLDYQRWLEAGAPYDVVIPYRRAILAAYTARQKEMRDRGEKPNVQLRLRRDIHGFLTAIKTSAILYQAQRKRDHLDRTVAGFVDYENAYEAFEPGLATLYRIKVSDALLAVVKAVEAIDARQKKTKSMFFEGEIPVSVSALMDELGISGRKTAYDRLKGAVAAGYLEVANVSKGTLATSYKIVKSSAEIAKDIETGKGAPSLFPSLDEVKNAGGGVDP